MESASLWDALACLRADSAKLISPTRSENALGPHCTASALLSRPPQWHQEESTSTKQAGAKSSTCTHGPPTRAFIPSRPDPATICAVPALWQGLGRGQGAQGIPLCGPLRRGSVAGDARHNRTPRGYPPPTHFPLPPFPIPFARFCRRATHFSVFRKRAALCCVHERLRAI